MHRARSWLFPIALICSSSVCAVASASAQPPNPSAAQPSGATTTPLKDAAQSLTLSGCVSRSDAKGGQFMFSEGASPGGKTPTTYILSGKNVRGHIGRRVTIVGGLVPSPNVAAQMGALNTSQSSMIAAGGSPSGTAVIPTPEFRVKVVRSAEGACPK